MIDYIYGRNSVLEALKNNIEIYEVILQNSREEEVIEQCKKRNIKFTIERDRKKIEKLVGNAYHQGIVAIIKGYEYASLETILKKIPEAKIPLLVMLDGLKDPHNLGAILRTCDAIGVDGVIIGKHRSVSLNATVAKVSTGAIEHVPVTRVTNLARTLQDLKKQGYWIVGSDMENASDYREVDYKMPIVLVVGSEGNGISDLVLKQCDYIVKLPMVGHVTSLNASVATAVLLYQIHQSREPLNRKG